MSGGKEGEKPPRKRKEQRRITQTEQDGSRGVARTGPPSAEQEAVYNKFWSELITRSDMVPEEDPAFWPAEMLLEFRDFIQNRDQIPNPRKRAYMEKLAPIEETIRRVEIAYKIIAYPHVQRRGLQEYIGVFLETDRQMYGRDQIELTDRELAIVQQLCETPRIAMTRDPATPV